MKKKFLTMMGLCALCVGTMAQTVTVADVNARPGETVEFSLNLAGGKAATYTALSFDVQFPKTGFTTTGAYKVSDSWKGAMAVVGDVDALGLATIPFASAETITGTDVDDLVSVSFKVDETIELGTYNVTLKNILFEYGMSDKDNAPDVTFQVNVSNSILLDEASTTTIQAASGVDVRVLRSINAGEWSTICLPFAMSEAQVKAAFGSDVELADFKGAETVFDKSDNVVGIRVSFDEVTAIAANHPYLIKVSTAVEEFTADGVDIVPQEDDAYVEYDNGRTGSRRVVYSGFYGTYRAATVLDEASLYLNGGQYYYSSGDVEMKAFRAYFVFLDELTDRTAAATQVIIDVAGQSTGIDAIDEHASNSHIYDLQGRKIADGQLSNRLRKGIYVRNNKKVVLGR